MVERKYMELAIDLAKKGVGQVNPNPLVGAVIVKDGRIIGQGWHEKYGGLHAERNALKSCSSPEGATMYVTLTPCCHYGKTPPCTSAILESGIARVVIGSEDPNPLVGKKSLQLLREGGVEVVTDFLKEECDRLNPVFFHYIQNKTPYVVLKFASTLDGKIASFTGASRWITGEEARNRVQQSRCRYAAIMVGSNTVKKDDPLLTCRIPGGRNPLRIVCDTRLTTPLGSKLIQTAKEVPLLIATAVTDKDRLAPYRAAGVHILKNPAGEDGHIDLKALMHSLGDAGIDSILLEGGGTLNWSALQAGIVHRVEAYIAPKIFGGKNAPSPVGGRGVELPSQAFALKGLSVTRLGEDILLEGEVKPCLPE